MTARVGRYRDQVRAAVEAVEICSSSRFRWLGADVESVPPVLQRALDPRAVRAAVVDRLTEHLYRWFYAQGGTARPRRPEQRLDNDAFVRECSQDLSTGWAGPPFDRSDGYFMLRRELGRSEPMVRLYLNTGPSRPARLAAVLATSLERAGCPFMIKFLDDPGQYDRCDPCVLYLRAADLTVALPMIGQDGVDHGLRAAIPAFTRMVGPGVGMAEDPRSGRSFGEDRCAVVAEGLIRSWERGITDVESRLSVIAACFAEHGLDIDAPFLAARTEEATCGSAPQ